MSPVELAALEKATLEAGAVLKMRSPEPAFQPGASSKVTPAETHLLVKHPPKLLALGHSTEEEVAYCLIRNPLESCWHFKTAHNAVNVSSSKHGFGLAWIGLG